MINDLTIFEQITYLQIHISNFKIILDKINFKNYYNIKNYFFFQMNNSYFIFLFLISHINFL